MQRVRRSIRVGLAFALALLGWTFVNPGAQACACGGVFSEASSTSVVPQEVALIEHDGSRERVTMSLQISSTATQAGLVVPTPTPATVSLGDRAVFATLSTVIAPVVKTRHHFIGGPEDAGGFGGGSGGANAAPASSVQELSTVDLGPLQATTLKAGDAAGLRSWLSSHHYVVRPQVQTELDRYVTLGWSFVAMQLTPQGKAMNGDLPPIVMDFDSAQLVYPMRMSRAATSSAIVRTYVLSDHRVQRADATAGSTPVSTLYAGRPAAAAAMPASLRQALGRAPYLTAIQQKFATPSTEILGDFSFARAPDDTPYQQVIYRDVYVMTLGTAIVLAMLTAAVLLGAGIGVSKLRARRRRG